MSIRDDLATLIGARAGSAERDRVLLRAADEGRIASITCTLDVCLCPQGREYFEPAGFQHRGPWAPSADRWPVPGRDGGGYTVDNVRLTHSRCNSSAGGKWIAEFRRQRGDYQSEAHRATSREVGRKSIVKVHEQNRASGLYQSAAFREAASKGAVAQAKSRQESGYYQQPEVRERLLRSARKASCSAALKKGRPDCFCGQHG